ncbi:MAG TPA: PD-(D/E)XK nuclease family protein [Candidatus Eisenbacteria bacterium]|nr:PD-(D/E)XK nuclease family protein [Candidatus Eisenbacteria bacterium]
MSDLPLIRHSERVDFKRCQMKWYWRWRKGLVPKQKSFGALDLGTWMHAALAIRYSPGGHSLSGAFEAVTHAALQHYAGPDYARDKADELAMLGQAMATAYDREYGDDSDIKILAVEIPLEFEIRNLTGELIALHKLKPDAVFRNAGGVWLFEHKTAAQIRTEHLPIDDQARPYVAMAEIALENAGILKRSDKFRGIMYNFLRKALPDQRPRDGQGRYLNQNGTVSAKQPSPYFQRLPLEISAKSKRSALLRLGQEAHIITEIASDLRKSPMRSPLRLMKTPHSSCPKLCPFFEMCKVQEDGGDVRMMERTMYERRDPYLYEEETTDIPPSFELS